MALGRSVLPYSGEEGRDDRPSAFLTMANGTAWLTVKPVWSRYGSATGRKKIEKLDVTKVTVKKPAPSSMPNGAIAVKLTIEVDDDAFYPIEPSVDVHVPVEIEETAEVSADPVKVGKRKKNPSAPTQT